MSTRNRPPTKDALTAPFEPIVDIASSAGLWGHVLAGPTIWFAHFMVVYMMGEMACQGLRTGWFGTFGPSEINMFTVVATVVATLACLLAARVSWRAAKAPGGNMAHTLGWVLSLGGAGSVLLVGLPVLWLDTCGF